MAGHLADSLKHYHWWSMHAMCKPRYVIHTALCATPQDILPLYCCCTCPLYGGLLLSQFLSIDDVKLMEESDMHHMSVHRCMIS